MTLTQSNAAALAAARNAKDGHMAEQTTIKRIRILKGTVCGARIVAPGWVVDASLGDARLLVGSGKAEYAEGTELNESAPKAATKKPAEDK